MSVVKIEDEIAVDAPALEVWKAIKNPSAHAQWHPFLTEISGEHGLKRNPDFRAGFSLSPTNRGTVVTATSTLEPKNMLVRAMLPLIRRKFHQTHHTILAALKHSLEEPVALDSNRGST
jgi:hypothetical protein